MIASPTRVDCDAPGSGDSSPLQQGNLVLESIARHESMRALLTFSELHAQIRNRRDADNDLIETERFILDECLQLICDRARTITAADSVLIALAESSASLRPELICRAAAGVIHIARGTRLIDESEFLQDALASGRVLRCDDGESDARVELDFAHQLGARSTVLVPLRGRREQLGVLQAFSNQACAFGDHDVRSFELFAELVLSALKPKDQDRRIHWLSDVAAEVLQSKTQVDDLDVQARAIEPEMLDTAAAIPGDEIEKNVRGKSSVIAGTVTEIIPVAAASHVLPAEVSIQKPNAPEVQAATVQASAPTLVSAPVTESDPVTGLAGPLMPVEESSGAGASAITGSEIHLEVVEIIPAEARPPLLSFLPKISYERLRPGLNVMMVALAVAALFSAGAWWGMRAHGYEPPSAAAAKATETNPVNTPQSVTAPALPRAEILTPVSAPDNLMTPAKVESDAGSLTAVPSEKLAALPKITGVRHWTSSLGSTVVIDMEDPVPYEVHRLMSPERIYFDLHDTVLSPSLDGATMDVGDISLTRVRVAQPVSGLTRIVLDTKDGSNFSVSMNSNPYRLVIELRGGDKNVLAKSTAAIRTPSHSVIAPPTAGSSSASSSNTSSGTVLPVKAATLALLPKTGKTRIVLDAGHGGWDLGTVGRQGLLEKDLVLDVTQRLGKLLQSRLGFDVMFTRDGDSYLPLDQRADFANQAQADLFVSVHANYSSTATARGVETYYSNLFSAPGSREVEKHEDGTIARLTPVSLSSGGLHDKIEESRKLAANVQRALYATLASNNPDIRDRGTKNSSFVVLTGTTMPSILTEISFVSSPADEQNLQSATYRQQIAEALYQGIAHYQHASPRTKVAQLQTAAARQ
jgi:N-acetylmuramoyl-L-alanine amidase